MNYDESTIEEIQAAYECGEFEQDDPEIAGIRRARRQREALDLGRDRERSLYHRTINEVRLHPGTLHLDTDRTSADIVLESIAGRHGYRAEPWTGPQGPMAIAEIRDDTESYADLITLWETDPTAYLVELQDRRLIR